DLVHALLEQPFAASWRRRRLQELAARQDLGIVGASAHANELLDAIVVRRQLRVRDRPRDFPAIALCRLEVHLRVAQADPAPDVRFATVSPHAGQVERTALGREIWLLLRVEKK